MNASPRRVWPRVRSVAAVAALACGSVGWSAGHAAAPHAGPEAPAERAAVAEVAHANSARGPARPGALNWTPTRDQLRAAAAVLDAMASGANGKLVSATWTATTRGQYLAATGEGSLADARAAATKVIVVVGTGAFTFTNISVPYGAPTPRGNYIECAFDPVTGSVTDWGTDDTALDQLGPVHPLPLGQPGALPR